jgi:nitroreductase
MTGLIQLINQHRTVRKYTSKTVSEDILNTLVTAATRTSNTGNMQAYSIVVTTDSGIKQALAPAHFNQPMVVQAPVVLTFCADFNRFSIWCKERNAEPGYDNFQSFMATAIDALIAAQTLCLAAESLGLGICYLGTTTYNAQQIIDVLELPRLVVPVTTITLGYPDGEVPITDRLPLEAVVHREKYTDYSATRINELYAEKEDSEFYKNFIKENNKETLAQVFTDIRYTKSANELFSDKFIQVLKNQGFLK